MKTNHKNTSKFLSLILRHNPAKIGLQLDDNGWADVTELLSKSKNHSPNLDIDLLKEIVQNNDKKRFAFNDDQSKIRANQGHSLDINLGYIPKQPPEFLYHGTVSKFIDAIKEKGILKMSRHHVHLSQDRETAIKVGSRRGKPIVLTLRSGAMHTNGVEFFQSDNGVWLTDHVLPEYIEFKN
ncbi:RNA 2'-phosphotransferase [Aquimarina sp. AD10]|uniref:RNA 2'-phosphotransferase n=1 Tax=Aquimarina sp. AD10 TaxID=1714849 RepID=UPI000E544BED|nr:RNA 2'-phosphotransferase [Aquimarina sp. AD10]AXT59570.1 RNA 2'-phosphotransferase [Aquimarina sp. AD10]RKM92408.1 RNA 2'-phosphotransferase [Aquimarina sp. AD10]